VRTAKNSVSDIQIASLEVFIKGTGSLAVIEKDNHIRWQIERIFFISAESAEERGDHAHKTCQQFFVCISGEVKIRCDDGDEEREFTFSGLNQTLSVPPGIWVNIEMGPGSSLGVIADQKYDESDYIRNWTEFLIFRGPK